MKSGADIEYKNQIKSVGKNVVYNIRGHCHIDWCSEIMHVFAIEKFNGMKFSTKSIKFVENNLIGKLIFELTTGNDI